MFRRRAQEANRAIAEDIVRLAKTVFGSRIESITTVGNDVTIRVWPLVVSIAWIDDGETMYWGWGIQELVPRRFWILNRLSDMADMPERDGSGDRDQMLRFLYKLRDVLSTIGRIAKKDRIFRNVVRLAKSILSADIRIRTRSIDEVVIDVWPFELVIGWTRHGEAILYSWGWDLHSDLPWTVRVSMRTRWKATGALPEGHGRGYRRHLMQFLHKVADILPTAANIAEEEVGKEERNIETKEVLESIIRSTYGKDVIFDGSIGDDYIVFIVWPVRVLIGWKFSAPSDMYSWTWTLNYSSRLRNYIVTEHGRQGIEWNHRSVIEWVMQRLGDLHPILTGNDRGNRRNMLRFLTYELPTIRDAMKDTIDNVIRRVPEYIAEHEYRSLWNTLGGKAEYTNVQLANKLGLLETELSDNLSTWGHSIDVQHKSLSVSRRGVTSGVCLWIADISYPLLRQLTEATEALYAGKNINVSPMGIFIARLILLTEDLGLMTYVAILWL